MKIYGKNPVLERLKSNPRSIRVIYVEAGHPEHSYIASKAKKNHIPITVVDARRMLKLGRDLNTQGLLMEVEDFQYADYEEILETAEQEGITFIYLDGLNDPQNLGSIIRSAGCLGGFVIVLPTHGSVQVTETALRIASGAENFIRVCKVSNLNNAIQKAKDRGYTIAGSVLENASDMRTLRLPFPLGLVIGAEDKGIRDVTQQRLDLRVRIPMAHQRLSLNAANATSILCFEIVRQKNLSRRSHESKIPTEGPQQSTVTEADLPE